MREFERRVQQDTGKRIYFAFKVFYDKDHWHEGAGRIVLQALEYLVDFELGGDFFDLSQCQLIRAGICMAKRANA